VNFTLRSGIKFADGEPLNSTAVYFSLNRLLVIDSSTPASHGSGPTFLIGQLLNSSISYGFGGTHPYNQAFVNNVLAQNFVQVTGPLTFSLHFLNPSVAWPYFFTIGTTDASDAMAPIYVMEHDLALWNQSSTGYTLPYPSLTGNLTSMTYQYLLDEAATCDNGLTPHGCGQTYLDESSQGSLAGTGPYVVKSFAASTGDVVLSANPSYWGGPSGSIKPQIPTININYVPDETSRELDLKNAALAGNGMTVDITADHLYDVASRAAWLNNGSLVSITPGVTLYGPYTPFETNFDPFVLNVSNPFSGELYTFQPFADIRFRLAFADSVNLTNINTNVNNNMGKVATELIPPGLPPSGAYNSSLPTRYSLNLTATQNLLLDAMMHPITTFHFTNGTVAPQGFFNNTFGCVTLNSNNQCSSPAAQTVPLVFPTGDTVDESIDEQMAQVVNNISSTYNMGLTVSVIPLPFGQMVTRFFSAQQYFFSWGWTADYPWALDFLGPMFAVNAAGFAAADNWNLTQMTNLYGQAAKATSSNNVSGVVTVSNAMNELANQEVMYLYTFNPVSSFASSFSAISPITSNIQGYYFNAATSGIYYAALY